MNRSVTDTLRGLLVIALMLIIRGQTVWAQDAPSTSSSDASPATTMFPHQTTAAGGYPAR